MNLKDTKEQIRNLVKAQMDYQNVANKFEVVTEISTCGINDHIQLSCDDVESKRLKNLGFKYIATDNEKKHTLPLLHM